MVVLPRRSRWQAVAGPGEAGSVHSPADVLRFKCSIWKMFGDIDTQICMFYKGQDQQSVHTSHGCHMSQQDEGEKGTEP